MKQFLRLVQESCADGEDQLKQHDGQKDRHIDNDQPGNSIARVKLIPDVVCYGFKHFLKLGLFEDNVQRQLKAWQDYFKKLPPCFQCRANKNPDKAPPR